MRVTRAGVAVLAVALVAVTAALTIPSALAARRGEAAVARVAAVAVSPSPGERFATPQTTISFRGITPAVLGRVRVTGSRSGAHLGSVMADPDGATIWRPRTGFVAGER